MPETPAAYARTSIAPHWLLAAALAGCFALGVTMTELPMSPQRLQLFSWHKWAGVTILALSALRLLWRLAHRATYLLFFAVPLAGWAYSSAAGFPVVWLGVVPLPDWVSADEALAQALEPLHGFLAKLLAAIVLVHIAAAAGERTATASGQFTIKRLAFRIGEGEWSDPAFVADDALVRFRLVVDGLRLP